MCVSLKLASGGSGVMLCSWWGILNQQCRAVTHKGQHVLVVGGSAVLYMGGLRCHGIPRELVVQLAALVC